MAAFPDPVPSAVTVTRAASAGWLLEGGLSAAGSLVRWLSELTGQPPHQLMARAAAAPAGAGGLVALPWFGGARAPWWRSDARGALVGLSFDHDAGDLARAVVEAVAWEVRRCLVATGALDDSDSGSDRAGATALALTGTGGTDGVWAAVVTAVTGLPGVRRRSGQAASAGAALIAAGATGAGFDLDTLDPVVETVVPDAAAVAGYAGRRPRADGVAGAVVELGP